MNIGFVQKRKYAGGNKANGLSKLCSTEVATKLEATILTPKITPKINKPLIINWGLSNIPWLDPYVSKFTNKFGNSPVILNSPSAIHNAVNKTTALRLLRMSNVPTLEMTVIKDQAKEWFDQDEKAVVFCRTLASSFQGKGIVIAKNKEELVDAPLYTLRIPKKWEYRVHVLRDKVVKIQQKKRLSLASLAERGIPVGDGLIRSYNNGYIFSTNLYHSQSHQVIQDISSHSIEAVKALGLDFGAVDVLVTKSCSVHVLEVNTAPGIEGSTVDAYVEAFNNLAEMIS